ncbi:MAG: M16 family metallopeptidase [Pseudomonadota bacterium]|jgi:zinc protease
MPRACYRMFTALAALFAVMVLSTPSLAALKVQRVTSPGGIKAWLAEEHALPMIVMNFAFRGGAKLDPPGRLGLANLAASTIDEGAGEMDSQAFQTRLEELAIQLGFQADQDAFHGRMKTLTQNRAEAFRLLKLALGAPRFDEEPVARIKAQILAGLRADEEDPQTIASKAWFAAAFPDHPYGRPDKGEADQVKQISASDLRQFIKSQFTRDRLVITVAGDIGAKELGRLLDEAFGGLPEGSGAAPSAPVAPQVDQNILIEREIPQTVIMFGLPGMLRKDPDFIPAYVMNYILGGGGFSSRLTTEIREKRGLAYSVYSYLMPLEQSGLFVGGVATQNERAGETVRLLRQELKRLRDKGVTGKELEDAKTYLTGSFPLRFDSNAKIAAQLNGLQLEDLDADYLERRNNLIRAVTREDVNRVARRLLNVENLLVVSVGQPAG